MKHLLSLNQVMNKSDLIRRSLSRHMFSSTACWDFDVLVSGGGVVGAAFAADLMNKTKSKCKIGIIENKPPHDLKTEKSLPDVRIYALSPKSISLLKNIGAWQHIENRSHPYTTMQIWETNGPGLVRFKASDLQADELGRTCEDITIQAAIYQAMRDAGHSVEFIYGSSVSDVQIRAGEMDLVQPAVVTISKNKPPGDKTATEHRTVTTRLLVGADGAMSTVRRLCGVSTWGWGYGQEAVVATVKLADSAVPLNHTAWQRYLSTGPLALLPLWDGYCSIVWSTSVTEVRRLKGLSSEAFLAELNAALQTPSRTDKWSVLEPEDGVSLPPFLNMLTSRIAKVASVFDEEVPGQPQRLNPLQRLKREFAALADTAMSASLLRDPFRPPPVVRSVESPRISFPLSFSQASTYVTPRVALIGDAAHSIHPQAGQGLNLGLLDAECLSNTVARSMGVGADCGDIHMLQRYHEERYGSNLAMMGVVDGVNRVFSDRATPYSNVTAGTADEGKPPLSDSEPSPLARDMDNSTLSGASRKTKQFARSLGMLAVHGLGPAKNRMAQFAMGLGKDKKEV